MKCVCLCEILLRSVYNQGKCKKNHYISHFATTWPSHNTFKTSFGYSHFDFVRGFWNVYGMLGQFTFLDSYAHCDVIIYFYLLLSQILAQSRCHFAEKSRSFASRTAAGHSNRRKGKQDACNYGIKKKRKRLELVTM